MAPKDLEEIINKYVSSNNVMIFSKSSCPFCTKVKDLFEKLDVPYFALELDKLENGPEIQDVLELKTGQRTVPNVFVSGVHIGGCDKTMEAHKNGRLKELISPAKMDYDYDLIVIGGGSGGLAAAKEAATLGAKVAVLDFVKPSPVGSTWGLGGTCVNVGCIPKKLMHYAGVLGKAIKDSQSYGWKFPQTEEKKEQQPSWIYPVVKVDHEWDKLREGVQNYIASLNWNYRVALREKKVDYINAYAQFVSPNTIKVLDKKQKEHTYTAERFLLSTGLRPRYPDIPGAKEFGITSDDLFSLKYPPGKTLCVGASYVSLECAGFLKQIGFEVDVMVRSILLRGFDQQMAQMVGNNLEQLGVRFYREYVPTSIEQIEAGEPGKLKVTFKKLGNESGADEVDSEEYNTVLFAIGRDPCTPDLKLDNIGVRVNPKNGKVPVTNEQSNVPYVYALGDIADEKLELTPVAIQAGVLLARRLYGGSNLQCDYSNVPTTVFTPVEYSCVGYTEELAIEKFGEENVEVYHLNFAPLDYALPGDMSDCYVKLICLKSEKVKLLRFCWKSRKVKEKVVGLHLLCPNSGEIMQGFALAVKLGATKADFDGMIGIHPTSAEILTTLSVTKRSGADTTAGGC